MTTPDEPVRRIFSVRYQPPIVEPAASDTATVKGSLSRGRRATLEALRHRLAEILDGTAGHQRGCECECGAPWDAGKVAPIVRELREVIREIEDLPNEGGGSEVDRIQREREERRRQAEAERAEGAPGTPAP